MYTTLTILLFAFRWGFFIYICINLPETNKTEKGVYITNIYLVYKNGWVIFLDIVICHFSIEQNSLIIYPRWFLWWKYKSFVYCICVCVCTSFRKKRLLLILHHTTIIIHTQITHKLFIFRMWVVFFFIFSFLFLLS